MSAMTQLARSTRASYWSVSAPARRLLGAAIVALATGASSLAQTELVQNGGFETGFSPGWVSSGSFYAAPGFPCPHGGSRYAYLLPRPVNS